jgi:hypothetical protein
MPGISAVSADQGAAGELAALRDALDDIGRDLRVELAAGEIVEEEKRLRTLHQHIVRAHRHEINADGVVAAQREGELELGADAIGAGDKHRLLVLLRDLAQCAEAADAGQHFRPHRPARVGLDGLDERSARVYVDTGLGVGRPFWPVVIGSGSAKWRR